MEGLKQELNKLRMKSSSVTSNMIDVARRIEAERDVIEEPERVAKLAAIAQAFMSGKINRAQAELLVRRV
jgi:hypothetical protein